MNVPGWKEITAKQQISPDKRPDNIKQLGADKCQRRPPPSIFTRSVNLASSPMDKKQAAIKPSTT
jgi:hypothetical protein